VPELRGFIGGAPEVESAPNCLSNLDFTALDMNTAAVAVRPPQRDRHDSTSLLNRIPRQSTNTLEIARPLVRMDGLKVLEE
jgi:hypothetical protein